MASGAIALRDATVESFEGGEAGTGTVSGTKRTGSKGGGEDGGDSDDEV